MKIVNLILSIFASIIVLFGLISMLTPIPGGALLIAGGTTSLICTSPRARLCLKFARSRANWFNMIFFWLENKIGKKIKVVGNSLAKTHPEKINNK